MGNKEIYAEYFGDLEKYLDKTELEPKEPKTFSLQISKTDKEKFDDLQERSNKEFGKRLRRLVCDMIRIASEK